MFMFNFFMQPKINERDIERERLRRENQNLRELLNSMHARQRVEEEKVCIDSVFFMGWVYSLLGIVEFKERLHCTCFIKLDFIHAIPTYPRAFIKSKSSLRSFLVPRKLQKI